MKNKKTPPLPHGFEPQPAECQEIALTNVITLNQLFIDRSSVD